MMKVPKQRKILFGTQMNPYYYCAAAALIKGIKKRVAHFSAGGQFTGKPRIR